MTASRLTLAHTLDFAVRDPKWFSHPVRWFGCPIRSGDMIGHAETVGRIRSLLPTWPVTQLAIDSLAEAVADREYAEMSLRENAVERQRPIESLRELGLLVFPPAANYLFLELRADMPAAAELRARLIRKHRVLIRNCDSYEGLRRDVMYAWQSAPVPIIAGRSRLSGKN